MANISVSYGIFSLFIFQIVAGSLFDSFLSESTSCKSTCKALFPDYPEFEESCSEGCRLFDIIGLSKGFDNKTIRLCQGACSEAFTNKTLAISCKNGCHYNDKTKLKNETQTLHLLTPFVYIQSAYDTVAHHAREFLSASWTVYVQEDSGGMVLLKTGPKIERIEDVRAKHLEEDRRRYLKNFKNQNPVETSWEEADYDWMDCILSRPSGLPRFILVLAFLGTIVVLIWLCCATAVTAPHHYLSSPKMEPRSNLNYVLVCEPNTGEIKCPPPIINTDEDAPPLPPKVSLI